MKLSPKQLRSLAAIPRADKNVRDWSAEFNALPPEIRTIGAAMELRTRIQHLNIEKERLRKRYCESLTEIQLHIQNCEHSLRQLEKP